MDAIELNYEQAADRLRNEVAIQRADSQDSTEYGLALSDDIEIVLATVEKFQKFKDQIDLAHQTHLRTGDYGPLGMAAQDALQEFERD